MPNVESMETEALLVRLRELEKAVKQINEDRLLDRDRMEIWDLLNLYTRAVDRFDWSWLTDIFHDDAILNHGSQVMRPQELGAWLESINKENKSSTMHTIHNHVCEIEGNVAHAETYLIAFDLMKDGKSITMLGARYIDKFERRAGRWKIAVRRVIAEWWCSADTLPYRAGWSPGLRDRQDPSYLRPLALPLELQERADALPKPTKWDE